MSMTPSGTIVVPTPMKHMPHAYVDQANPTSGNPYEWSSTGAVAGALGTQRNVKIRGISVSVTWGVQPNPLEVRIIIDGVTYLFTQANPVSGTVYVCILDERVAEDSQAMTSGAGHIGMYLSELMEGRSVRITFETTGGTVTNLSGRVIWEQAF